MNSFAAPDTATELEVKLRPWVGWGEEEQRSASPQPLTPEKSQKTPCLHLLEDLREYPT